MGFTRTDVKLSFDKPVFYINEEKKTVVCTLRYHLQTPVAYDDNNCFSSLGLGNIRGHVTQMSKCHPDDTFDTKVGTEIAYARAENMAYVEAMDHISKYNAQMLKLHSIYADFEIKYRNHNLHNKNYIKELGDKG